MLFNPRSVTITAGTDRRQPPRSLVAVAAAALMACAQSAEALERSATHAAVTQIPAVSQQVLVVFDPIVRHIDRVFDIRARIEAEAGRVRLVYGLAAVVADVVPGSIPGLTAAPGVARVATTSVASPPFDDAATKAAVTAWNALVEPQAPPPRGPAPAPSPSWEGEPPPPPDAGTILRHEVDYPAHWAEERRELPAALRRSGAGCGSNGAGYNETSLYLAGDVAVGVFYEETDGPWTASAAAGTFASVSPALNHLITLQPNARLTFTFSNEVDGVGAPLPLPSDPPRTYDNDLRNTWCTDWAFLLSVSNGGTWPMASLHGPRAWVDTTFADFPYVVRHETAHVFGALDAYLAQGSTNTPSKAAGYLGVTHGNACNSDGTGYFSGAGECLSDLMNGWPYNSTIGAYTAGQVGWHDLDGDGLFDVRETMPTIDPTVSHTAANPPTYTGIARERPVPSELAFPSGSVSIEHIVAVEYRINGSAWQPAFPADGVWDSASENFVFSPPTLRNGTHAVDIRARNSAGTVTATPLQESLQVSGSTLTNTRPFGTLAVSAPRAKFGTVLTASAVGSTDLETPSSGLQYSWDVGNGAGWSSYSTTPTTSFSYAGAGPRNVQVRVRDAGFAVHVLAKTVMAEAYDVAPVVALRVVPERRHGPNLNSYAVSLTLGGTTDGETPFASLLARWDLDDNGTWDSTQSFTAGKTRSATLTPTNPGKTDRRRLHVQVTDGANVVDVYRFVWFVPYNGPPSLGVSFTPAVNGAVNATASGSDPNLATTWDGSLEYRWDPQGDGIWDTPFLTGSTMNVPASSQSTLRVEVKDRFHAIAAWPSGSGQAG